MGNLAHANFEISRVGRTKISNFKYHGMLSLGCVDPTLLGQFGVRNDLISADYQIACWRV